MAAVLRVKRRHDDEPLNALLIACKRSKSADDEEAPESAATVPLTAVVKFAGTVKNQEDNVVQHLIQTLGKDELKANFKQHSVDIINKARERAKQASAENRYKVINCFRSLDSTNHEVLEDKIMTVIDVEDSVSCAVPKEHSTQNDEGYVYDLYFGQTENELHPDNMLFVHPLDQELVFDTYRNNHSDIECESEDSNSESNWRNDYPDSDHSERSIDDEDMKEAVRNLRLEDGSDLSSEDDFVYAVNEKDVESYGYKYAKYKARVKNELDEDDSDDSEYSGEYVYEEADENSDSTKNSD
ncbi:probable RNA polymerase II nuclear localization protein SLC7A6OS [Hylaeus anthracinus]|uniref:probable RNA polymerase II nuclear localization protein SLC7A6OS n=1 Tax=Hylaeus anthracinus TaxID=313031 RepID=UPI0023B8A0D9|nr:probable RNA polymerase II nuclear localization protein SLC7A6OS [Hylaeus anthracinus]